MATKTRHEQALDAIRGDILAGRLEPGRKLAFAELGQAYGVSIGSLREALSRLVEQGLVRSSPQVGFFVMPLSRRDLLNLTTARREIEGLTLRHAISEGDLQWESDVIAAHHRLASTPMVSDSSGDGFSEEWASAHRGFHEAILRGCANPRLTAIATQLRAAAELYQRWSLPLSTGKRDIPGEHLAIMQALLARDADQAVTLLDAHIARTTELLLSSPNLDETG